MTLGIGVGQTNRLAAARHALEAAGERAKGAVLASDAFFPFDDVVRLAASYGIAAIIQPGGACGTRTPSGRRRRRGSPWSSPACATSATEPGAGGCFAGAPCRRRPARGLLPHAEVLEDPGHHLLRHLLAREEGEGPGRLLQGEAHEVLGEGEGLLQALPSPEEGFHLALGEEDLPPPSPKGPPLPPP